MSVRNSSGGLRPPVLCYVTDRRSLGSGEGSSAIDPLLHKIEEVISAGLDCVQIREKDLSGKELAHVVREALRIAAKYSANSGVTQILINDRLDLALVEGAGGVHLPEDGLPVAEAKRLVRAHGRERAPEQSFLVGVSCHSQKAAEAAAASGADYIFFGPIFATPSKDAYGVPQGLDRLASVCRAVTVPVLAIGGITPENAASCIAAGAGGIAAIRLFQDGSNGAAAAVSLHESLSRG